MKDKPAPTAAQPANRNDRRAEALKRNISRRKAAQPAKSKEK